MDGAIWVLMVAILIYATTLLIHRLVDPNCSILRLPATWFYASWLMGLLLLSLPIFKYFEEFDGVSGAYILAMLLSFSIGGVIAAFWTKSNSTRNQGYELKKEDYKNSTNISIKWINALLLMGFVGATLLLINSVLGGGLTLTDRFNADNFAAIRLEHMMEAESRIGPLYGPATLMSAIGGLGVAFVCYMLGAKDQELEQRRATCKLAYFVILTNVVIGFIGFGSRMYALFAILIGFIAFAEGRWAIGGRLIVKKLTARDVVKIVLSLAVVLSATWVAATLFLEKRVQSQDPNSLLYRTHRAELSTEVYDLTRNDTATQYFLFSLSYITTPIPTLVYYLDLPSSRQPGPFLGEYNFPALWRWGRRLTFSGDPYAWERARVEIFKPLADIQFGTNVWATLTRDLIADFTKAGALLFICGLGIFSQRIFDMQTIAPSARRAGLLVYLRLLLVFSGLISILFMPQVHWPLYFAIFMNLAWSKARKKGNVRSSNGVKNGFRAGPL